MKIALIGSGNLAFHIARGLFQHDITLVNVFGRNRLEGELLAQKFNTSFISEFNAENLGNLDLIIIAVSDNAIESIAKQISPRIKSNA